jgi:hypothetical protein
MPSAPTTVMSPHESRSDNNLSRVALISQRHERVLSATPMLQFVNMINDGATTTKCHDSRILHIADGGSVPTI